jgi:hypothetical protein
VPDESFASRKLFFELYSPKSRGTSYSGLALSGQYPSKHGRMRTLRRWKTQLLLILAVVGPGFITANVDAIRRTSFVCPCFEP